MPDFGRFLQKLTDLLLPPRCPGCYKLIPPSSGDPLCPDCRKKWEKHKTELCARCGQPIYLCWCNVPNNKDGHVASERHLVQYRSDVESTVYTLIHFMKRHCYDTVFSFIANELFDCVSDIEYDRKYVVTSVPRSKRSLRHFGHDQSYEIAKRFCSLSGLTYANILYHKGNVKQKKLSIKKRIENAKKSYYIKNGASEYIKNKIVYLIDDVVTTGATAVRCAHLLKMKGAKKVIVLSVAKTVK